MRSSSHPSPTEEEGGNDVTEPRETCHHEVRQSPPESRHRQTGREIPQPLSPPAHHLQPVPPLAKPKQKPDGRRTEYVGSVLRARRGAEKNKEEKG